MHRSLRLVVLCPLLLTQGCHREAASKPAPDRSPPGAHKPGSPAKPAPTLVARAPTPAPHKGKRARAEAPGGPRLDYDLRANLPLAHTYRAGVVADAAQVGFVKYTRDLTQRWKLDQREDGRPVAFPPGKQAQLWLPVGPELAGQPLVVEALIKPIRQQRLDLFVNGTKVGEPKLTGGWQQVRLALPGRTVKEGLAEVRLYFGKRRQRAGIRTCVAIRYARIALASAKAAPMDEAKLAAFLRPAASTTALRLPRGGGLDYYITPVKGLKLVGRAAGGKVAVLLQRDGEQPQALASAAALSVSLDAAAGQAVRLMLRGAGGDVTLDRAGIRGARPGARIAAAKPKHVIFWLIDALRADKLEFYDPAGATRPQVKTPNLSAAAAKGVVFDPFWVNSNESKAGHASFFTGTYPAVHGVLSHRAKLRESHLTIAEGFREAGYQTAGFISNGYISKRWNYHQGFQHSVNFIREGKPNDAKAVVKAAIPWINKNKDKPFYLYLGTSDTHVSYRVHKEFIKQYDVGPPYKGPYRRFLAGSSLGKIKKSKRRPSARERARIEAIYENELAYNDKHFGRLVAHLKKLGIDQQTLIIIAADHGEEFWEHGSCGHGNGLNREQVSVPLVLRWPGVLPAGKVVSGHDGVDLQATLLAMLGREQPEEVQGESLLPFVGAQQVYPRAMMASSESGAFALRVGKVKVIARSASAIDAYDLTSDPREQKDVSRRRTVLTLAGLDPLLIFASRAKAWRKRAWGVPNNLLPAFK